MAKGVFLSLDQFFRCSNELKRMSASYADVVQACSEFQENFSILRTKFNAQAEELKLEVEAHQRTKQKVQDLETRDAKRTKTVEELQEELSAARVFKSKYLEANLLIESLKSDLEKSRRDVADTGEEHEQEVKQLKGQLSDLEKRLSTATCSLRVKELQKQVLELEEKCTVVKAQLLEERATADQQILSAQSALREQQARNLELEQRSRSMETELADIRATVRRSAKLQNDAALMKERLESVGAASQSCAEELRREVQELNTSLEQVKTEAEAAQIAFKRSTDEERRALTDRVNSLTSMYQKAMSELVEERDRVSSLHSEVQRSAQLAREEAMTEVLALRKGMGLLKEDLQREQFTKEQLKENIEANFQLLENEEGKNAALQQQQKQLQVQLDAALQREAWALSEKRHSEERLACVQRQVEEISEKVRKTDHLGMDVERLQMQLKFREDELAQTQRYVHQLESKLHDVEDAATQRLQSSKKEIRHLRKQVQTEEAKADSLRRKLLRALVEKEQEAHLAKRFLPSNAASLMQHPPAFLPPGHNTCAISDSFPYNKPEGAADRAVLPSICPLAAGGPFSNFDVLDLLRSQTERAANLHDRLATL